MYKSKYFGFGKKSIILCSIIISSLFISSATAVPQFNGSLAVDKLDELNQNKILINLLSKNLDLNNLDSDKITINSLYMFTEIIGLEINMIDDSNSNDICNIISEETYDNNINEKDVIYGTKDCISSLSNIIDTVINNEDLSNKEYESLNILKNYISIINTAFNNKFYNNNDIINVDNVILDNGILERIISLILTILQFIVTVIKAILQGFFALFGGLIRTIGAIIGIIVLMLAEIQTILVLAGLYMISLGVLSKNIIKTLSGIGAPIFAAISAFLSIAFGTVLGSLSSAIFSIVGVIIILAIPISLVLAFLYFSGYFDDGNGDGLLYIISSSIVYYLKSYQ